MVRRENNLGLRRGPFIDFVTGQKTSFDDSKKDIWFSIFMKCDEISQCTLRKVNVFFWKKHDKLTEQRCKFFKELNLEYKDFDFKIGVGRVDFLMKMKVVELKKNITNNTIEICLKMGYDTLFKHLITTQRELAFDAIVMSLHLKNYELAKWSAKKVLLSKIQWDLDSEFLIASLELIKRYNSRYDHAIISRYAYRNPNISKEVLKFLDEL